MFVSAGRNGASALPINIRHIFMDFVNALNAQRIEKDRNHSAKISGSSMDGEELGFYRFRVKCVGLTHSPGRPLSHFFHFHPFNTSKCTHV